jgi:hypothetical protein
MSSQGISLEKRNKPVGVREAELARIRIEGFRMEQKNWEVILWNLDHTYMNTLLLPYLT